MLTVPLYFPMRTGTHIDRTGYLLLLGGLAKLRESRTFDIMTYAMTLLRLINAGSSLYQVQHQLACSDSRISQRYAHLLPENQTVVERIGDTGTTTILLQSKGKELQSMP
jgi:hypothetical protein